MYKEKLFARVQLWFQDFVFVSLRLILESRLGSLPQQNFELLQI